MSFEHWSLNISPEDIEWRDSDWRPYPDAPGLYARVGKIYSNSYPEGRLMTFFKSDVDAGGMIRVPGRNFDGTIRTTFRIHADHGKDLPFGNGETAQKMIQSYINGTMNHSLISYMGGPAYKSSEITPITEQEWNQYRLIARQDPWLGRFIAPSRVYEPSELKPGVNYADPEVAARSPEASRNTWQQYQEFLAQREQSGPLLDTNGNQAPQAPYDQPAGAAQTPASATTQPSQSNSPSEGRRLSGTRGAGDQLFTGELINGIPDWAHPYYSSMSRAWMLRRDPDKPVRWSEPSEWGAASSFTMTPRELLAALNAPPPEAGVGSPGARVTGEPVPVGDESNIGSSTMDELPDEDLSSTGAQNAHSARPGDWHDEWSPVSHWPGISVRRKYVSGDNGELRLRSYYKSEISPDGMMAIPSKYSWSHHHDSGATPPEGVDPQQNWYFKIPAQSILDIPDGRGNEGTKETIRKWQNGEASRSIYHSPPPSDVIRAINQNSFTSSTVVSPDLAISVTDEEFTNFSSIARYHPLVGYYIPSRSHFSSGDSYLGQDAQLSRYDEFIAYRNNLAESGGSSTNTDIVGEGEGGTETQEDNNEDSSPGRTLPEDDPSNISVGNISDVYNPNRHTDRSSGAQPGDSEFTSRTQIHMRIANIRANRGISQSSADVEEWVDRIVNGTHTIGDARTAINNLANEYEKMYAAQNQEDQPSAPTPPPPPGAPAPSPTPQPEAITHPKYDPDRHVDHSTGERGGDAGFTTPTQIRTRVRQIRENRGLNPSPESDEEWVRRISSGTHTFGDARAALQERAMKYKNELEQMQREHQERSAFHQPNDQNTSFTPGATQASQENTQHNMQTWNGGSIAKDTLSGNNASATPYVRPTETKPPKIV